MNGKNVSGKLISAKLHDIDIAKAYKEIQKKMDKQPKSGPAKDLTPNVGPITQEINEICERIDFLRSSVKNLDVALLPVSVQGVIGKSDDPRPNTEVPVLDTLINIKLAIVDLRDEITGIQERLRI